MTNPQRDHDPFGMNLIRQVADFNRANDLDPAVRYTRNAVIAAHKWRADLEWAQAIQVARYLDPDAGSAMTDYGMTGPEEVTAASLAWAGNSSRAAGATGAQHTGGDPNTMQPPTNLNMTTAQHIQITQSKVELENLGQVAIEAEGGSLADKRAENWTHAVARARSWLERKPDGWAQSMGTAPETNMEAMFNPPVTAGNVGPVLHTEGPGIDAIDDVRERPRVLGAGPDPNWPPTGKVERNWEATRAAARARETGSAAEGAVQVTGSPFEERVGAPPTGRIPTLGFTPEAIAEGAELVTTEIEAKTEAVEAKGLKAIVGYPTREQKEKAAQIAELTLGVPGLTVNPDIPTNVMPQLIAQTIVLNDAKEATGKTYADLLRDNKNSDGQVELIPLDVDLRPMTLDEYNEIQTKIGGKPHEVTGAQVRVGYEMKNLRDTMVIEMPDGSIMGLEEVAPGAIGAGTVKERHHPKALIAWATEPLKPLTQLLGALPYYSKQTLDGSLRWAASRNLMGFGDLIGVDHEAQPDKGFGSVFSETDLKYWAMDRESIGSGYFVGGAARIEQDKLAMEWGAINGEAAVTLGRSFVRSFGIDPGSQTFALASGIIDGTALVAVDPTTWIGAGATRHLLSGIRGRALVLENRVPGRAGQSWLDLNRRQERFVVAEVSEENKYAQDVTMIAHALRGETEKAMAVVESNALRTAQERVIRDGREYRGMPSLSRLFSNKGGPVAYRSSLAGMAGTYYSGGSTYAEIRRILPGVSDEAFDLRTSKRALDPAKGTQIKGKDAVTIYYEPGRMIGTIHVDDALDVKINRSGQSNKVRPEASRAQVDTNIRRIEVDLDRLATQKADGLISGDEYDEIIGLLDDLEARGFKRSRSKNKPVFTTRRERADPVTDPSRPWQPTPEGVVIPDTARMLDNDVGAWFDTGTVPELPDEVLNDMLGDAPMATRERALGTLAEGSEERLVTATNAVADTHVPGRITAGIEVKEGEGAYGGFDGFVGDVDMHSVPAGTQRSIPVIEHDPRKVGKPARGESTRQATRREKGARLEQEDAITTWPLVGDPLWGQFRKVAAARGDANAVELFDEALAIEQRVTQNYLDATGMQIDELNQADLAKIRAEADAHIDSTFPPFGSTEARNMVGDAMPRKTREVVDEPKRMPAVSEVAGTWVDPASLPNIVYRVSTGQGQGGRLVSDRGVFVIADEQAALGAADLLRDLDELPGVTTSMKWRQRFVETVAARVDDEDLINALLDLAKSVQKGQGREFARQAFRTMRERGMPIPGNLTQAKNPMNSLKDGISVRGVDKRDLAGVGVTQVRDGQWRIYGKVPWITEADSAGTFTSATHGLESVRFADDVPDPTFSMKLAPVQRGWRNMVKTLTFDEPAARSGARAGWLQRHEDTLYQRGWIAEPLPEQKAVRWHKPGSGEYDRVLLEHVDESERARYVEGGIGEGPVKVVTTERLMDGLATKNGTLFATNLLDAGERRLYHLAQGKIKVHVIQQIRAVQQRTARAVEEGVEGAREKGIDDIKEVLLVNSADLDPGLRALRSKFSGKRLDEVRDKPGRYDIRHKAPRALTIFKSAMPAHYVQVHDADEAMKQMVRWTKMLKFSDADTDRLLGMAMDAVTNQGRYSAFEELMRVSRDAVNTQMMRSDHEANRIAKMLDKATDETDRANLTARLDKRKGYHDLFARNVTRMFADGVNAERTVLAQMIADGVDTSLNSVVIGGKSYAAPPTHVLAEMLENVVPMPDPRNLRRAVNNFNRFVRRIDNDEAEQFITGKGMKGQGAFDTAAAIEDFAAMVTTKIWKPTTLIRVGYLARNMIDEQARMWASGAINPFSHPIDYFLTVMKTSRYDMTFIGERIGRTKDGSMILNTDVDNFAYNSMLSNGGVLADPLAAAKKMEKAGQGVVDIADTIGNASKIDQYVKGWAQTVTQIHHDNFLRRLTSIEGWTERDLQSLPQALRDEANPAEMLHWWIWNTKRGQQAWSQIVESTPDFVHLAERGASKQVLNTWDKILDTFLGQDPRMRSAVATGKVLDDADELVPIAVMKTGQNVAVNPALVSLVRQMHLDAEAAGDLTQLPPRVKVWDASEVKRSRSEVWDHVIGTAFKYLNDIPSDNLVRIPMFKAFYYDEALNLLPYMSKGDQAAVIKIAESRGVDNATGRIATFVNKVGGSRVDTAPKGTVKNMQKVSDSSPDIGILTRGEADAIAQRRATEKIRKLLYDTHDKRLVEDSMRILLPFMSAWRNGLMTWGKLLANPRVTSRAAAMQRVLSSEESGEAIYGDGHMGRSAMYRDPTTNEMMLNFPAGANYLAGAFGKVVGVPGVPTDYAQASTGSITGLNVFATATPGFGPVANLGAFGLNKLTPTSDIQQAIYDNYTMLNSGIEPGDPLSGMVPAAIAKGLKAVTGFSTPQTTRMYHTALADAATYLLSKDNTAASQPDFSDKVSDLADGMMLLRAGTQFFMPASGSPDATQKVYHQGNEMTAVMGELDEIRRSYNNTYGYEEGAQAFYRDFGESGLMVGIRGTRSRGTTQADAQTFEWLRDNPGMVTDYPDVFGVLVPVPSDNAFNMQAYQLLNRLQATEARNVKDYGAYAQGMIGGIIYEGEEKRIEAALAAGEIDKDEAADYKDAAMEAIRDRYPKYNNSFNPGTTAEKITQLEEASADPDLASNPAAIALGEYLTVRRDHIEASGLDEWDPRWNSKAATPYRDHLYQYGMELVQREPSFARAWDLILSKEVSE